MKIIPLSEGWFTVDHSKQFVPFDASADKIQDRPAGSLLVEIQPFVVVTTKDIILLDAGLGFSINGTLQLHSNLQAAGVTPDQITKVILSHLHKDHIGGIVLNTEQGFQPAFPNATYYVQAAELEHALSQPGASYTAPLVSWLSSYPKTKILAGSEFIDTYIECQLTSGHSRYHQAIWIREKESILFYGGDEAPQLQQMRHRFVAKYDFDGKRAMELRQQWWKKGEQENWTFLFYHDVKHPTFSFS
jgi:glyoxylase-like metal-dependent hydrolase (beta-lactamase superfamily II)